MSEQQPSGQPQGTPPAPPQHPGLGYQAPQPQPYPQQPQPYPQQGQPYPQQGQPYPQQGQPYPQAQPYAQNPSYPGAAPSAGTQGNGLGRTAFVIALVTLGIGLIVTFFTPLLYSSGGYAVADGLSTVIGVFVLLGNAAALVLGLIALRRPAPQVLAAIAIGIAGASITIRLFGWASTLLYYIGF